jgi:mannose-6-phosphate isomerase-like protein (cupin superfamily)
MQLVSRPDTAIDLDTTPIHLGMGSRAERVDDFGWAPEILDAYTKAVTDDGDDARLVMLFESSGSWSQWEMHPAGDEVVICLSGRMTMTTEIDGGERVIELRAGQALVNPRGTWHTADVHEPGQLLTITAGIGTEHRPR